MNCNGCIHSKVCKNKELYAEKAEAIKKLIGSDDFIINCKNYQLPQVINPVLPIIYPYDYRAPHIYWDDKSTGKSPLPYTWEITCNS